MEQQKNVGVAPQKGATSGLAIASLVLGVLGILTCIGGPVFGIPGLIFGLVALSKIGKSDGAIGGHGIAVAGTITSAVAVISIIFTGMMAGMMLPALSRAREEARKTVGESNLRALGVSCFMYAADNDDKFPDKLSDLYPKYLEDLSVFTCPSSGETVETAGEIDVKGSFVLISGLTVANSDAGTALAFERSKIHEGGSHVLYADGHVEWVDEERLKVLLSAPPKAP